MNTYPDTVEQDVINKTHSLDDLLEALQTLYAASLRGDVSEKLTDAVDMSALPTFGGDEPEDTLGVWSWDTSRLLVGDGFADLHIISRNEVQS